MLRLSVLDQSAALSGRSEDASIRETLALARRCDALGHHRFWVSEHHGQRQHRRHRARGADGRHRGTDEAHRSWRGPNCRPSIHRVGSAPIRKPSERLRALAARFSLDELVIVTWAHDPAVRTRSCELQAREFGLDAAG